MLTYYDTCICEGQPTTHAGHMRYAGRLPEFALKKDDSKLSRISRFVVHYERPTSKQQVPDAAQSTKPSHVQGGPAESVPI